MPTCIRHMQTYGVEEYCVYCGKPGSSSADSKREVAPPVAAPKREVVVVDTRKVTPVHFVCPVCAKKYNSAAGMYWHLREKHADAMRSHRADLAAELAQLEVTQDELLDRLLLES